MTAPADDRPVMPGLDQCIRCGLCLQACPTYLETLTETSGPRGRIRLMKEVAQGRLDRLSPGYVEQMWECLDCRACEAVCPSGVPYGRLVETARAEIRQAQESVSGAHRKPELGSLAHALFRHPPLMRAAARVLRFAQRTRLTGLAAAFGLRDAVALAPRIPNRFFSARAQRVEAARPKGLAFLHVGCIMPVAFPGVHDATMRLLVRAGLSVTAPGDQGCCGAIAAHAGELPLGREFAKRNIEAFERSRADVYVADAAGCGSALKEYAAWFEDDAAWAPRAKRFSDRVRDVTEVLDAMDLGPRARPLNRTVAYQDPCHLVHAQRVASAPRRLLASIPGLRLVELDEPGVCCGSAGIYNLTHPAMSERLRKRKIRAIRASGAAVVATANPGCAMQVACGLRQARLNVEVKHVVELLDDAFARPL